MGIGRVIVATLKELFTIQFKEYVNKYINTNRVIDNT